MPLTMPRRPAWAARKPCTELDYRALDAGGAPVFKSIMDAAERLAPRQILSVRIDFEPTLLYRLLDRRGFEHCSAPVDCGEWNILFHRRR